MTLFTGKAYVFWFLVYFWKGVSMIGIRWRNEFSERKSSGGILAGWQYRCPCRRGPVLDRRTGTKSGSRMIEALPGKYTMRTLCRAGFSRLLWIQSGWAASAETMRPNKVHWPDLGLFLCRMRRCRSGFDPAFCQYLLLVELVLRCVYDEAG